MGKHHESLSKNLSENLSKHSIHIKNSMHAFEAETRFSERAQRIVHREDTTLDEMRREYRHITQQYGVLLSEVMKITRVSDATQTELRRTRKELFVALQSAEIQRATAERLNAQKTEILSITAHDLKNPLGGILGLIDVLRDDTISAEEKQEILTMMQTSGERMLTILQNLLSNSTLELGTLNPEFTHCNLLTIVSEVIIGNTNLAQQKQQTITFNHQEHVSYNVYGDMTLLYEMCDNILSNAVKYSPLGETIHVRLERVVDPKTPMLRFSVRDHGPGLSEEDKAKLFNYFQRLSAQPTGGESSHGIGLAAAKKITELHRGRIYAESRRDEGIIGATFTIELPAEE